MSIKKISNYNTGIDLCNISVTEASYIIDSYIEESFNDLQIKCLMVDRRSIQESGVRYFTEENDTCKQRLGEKIKQLIKTVWDAIVGIFKKIRDFFKDMIEKMKEFFEKIKNKIFGKKKEELNATQDKYGLHQIDQKELVQYMKDLDDKVFRDSIDKNVTKYYDIVKITDILDWLVHISSCIPNDIDIASKTIDRVQKLLSDPLPELNKSSIYKEEVLDCAFGNFSHRYESIDSCVENLKKAMDPFSKHDDELDPQVLSLVKDNLKLITTFSQKYSSAMIHNTKELMKVVHYIYNNYDRDGVSVKESVDWSSIL
jgi:hypothetical protein